MTWFDRILKLLPIIFGVVLLFLVMNKINSCNNNVPIFEQPIHVVSQLTPVPQNVGDTAKVPDGRKIESVYVPTVKIASPRDKKITARYIIHSDPKCLTCTPGVTEDVSIKTKIGFVFEPKVYIGYTNGGGTGGLGLGLFRYGKTGLDLLVTLPYIGGGLSYLITDNFFVLGGANIKYISYNSYEEVGTYSIDLGAAQKVLPILGAGFYF